MSNSKKIYHYQIPQSCDMIIINGVEYPVDKEIAKLIENISIERDKYKEALKNMSMQN